MDITLSEPIKLDYQLVSIEYPGLVKNENEALKTMGGLDTISARCFIFIVAILFGTPMATKPKTFLNL